MFLSPPHRDRAARWIFTFLLPDTVAVILQPYTRLSVCKLTLRVELPSCRVEIHTSLSGTALDVEANTVTTAASIRALLCEGSDPLLNTESDGNCRQGWLGFRIR